VVAGSALTVIYFYYFVVVRTKKADDDSLQEGRTLAKLAQSSDERGSAILKRAGTRKVNKMLLNARRMHGDIDGGSSNLERSLTTSKKLDLTAKADPVFQTYVLYGEEKVPCGSWVWVYSRLFSKELFEVEGIWFPNRLWTFQVMQCVVLGLIIILIPIFITTAAKNADEANAELPEGLPSWIYELVPTGQQVRFALVPAEWIALTVCVCLILLYIPR
jgi:hypothetical protein